MDELLTEEDLKFLKKEFSSLLNEGDTYAMKSKVFKWFIKNNYRIDYSLLNGNMSNKISFPEFLTLYIRIYNEIELEIELIERFKQIDTKNTGYIDSNHLLEVYKKMGLKLSLKDRIRIYKKDKINIKDFLHILLN